jgi:hypothetical protein
MRMKVVGLKEVSEGVAEVTLINKEQIHKGFNSKFYLYVPIGDIDLWPLHSEVDVIVLATSVPAPGMAPIEHAEESSVEEGDRG